MLNSHGTIHFYSTETFPFFLVSLGKKPLEKGLGMGVFGGEKALVKYITSMWEKKGKFHKKVIVINNLGYSRMAIQGLEK